MTREMHDGIDPSKLPTTARMVAGYVDGLYRWPDASWARFPNAVKVRVAVFSQTNDGQVLDVEPGNATPTQSVDWVLLRRRAGVDPTVYMNTSTWPAVRAAFQARGVAEPHYWVAQYDGVASIPAGAVAKQYYNNDAAGYDLSVVADHWPGVDSDPVPVAAPITHRRDNVHLKLVPNVPEVLTNPGAILGGTSHLCLATDFNDSQVRVALWSFNTKSWSVTEHAVTRTGGVVSIALLPDVNKVSLLQNAGTSPVGVDIIF